MKLVERIVRDTYKYILYILNDISIYALNYFIFLSLIVNF